MVRGDVTLRRGHRVLVLYNEMRTVEMFHSLTKQFSSINDAVISSSVDHEALAETYTKVIVALATLQNSVKDLSTAYINHANTVLNPGRAGTLDLNLTSTLLDSGLLAGGAAPPGVKLEAAPETKKKRKRAAHDPNAPKRALTPYFLYMQSARPQIAAELGSNAKPKEVADEGTRRWSVMPEGDKRVCLSLTILSHSANILRSGTPRTKRTSPSTVSRLQPTKLDSPFPRMRRQRRLQSRTPRLP